MGPAIFMAIVITIFITGIVLVIYAPLAKRKNARCSEQTDGELLDIDANLERNTSGLTYTYSYNVNGTEYRLNTREGNPNTKNRGDHCTIWYNPANPKDAVAVRYDSDKRYKIMFITGIVMLSLIALFIVLMIVVATTVIP